MLTDFLKRRNYEICLRINHHQRNALDYFSCGKMLEFADSRALTSTSSPASCFAFRLGERRLRLA
jgi:hypothetical protein